MPAQLLGDVLVVYHRALMKAIFVAVAMSCVSIVGALAVEWKSIEKGNEQGSKAEFAAGA